MTRNEAREILMQVLYEMDASKTMDNDTVKKLTQQSLAGNHKERGMKLLTGIVDNLQQIDDKINQSSKSWKTGRMPKVDLAIMRLALGEISFLDDVPVAVTINEAINLAKKFSTEQSSRFIHGVLGAIVNSDEK